jgi:hypothetical protein
MHLKIKLGEEQLSEVEKSDVDISAGENVRDQSNV